ncbi:MAG TPA: lipopolysaccharide heptosyltransferase II [Methylotenera sp.]|nr:lipopolysaccharide heptosyltransferase II [Methylotenera sp.]HPH06043.1 lipopolysaccharide heptosyltransferase II [Methylotenera sp.]HPN00621.1 lipopolysaccharide heptosyltransferase II [Methylotenera sp.]
MSADKILVLGPAWVGDMVMAQSLFKTLKANRPNCTIDVAAPAWTLPLLERMPEVSGKIALPFKHGELAFWQRLAFGKSLKNQGYTQSIILTNSLKSALLPWAARIKKRTSFLGEMRYGLINDVRPLDKTKLKKTVERFVTLGLAKGEALPPSIPNPALNADKVAALAVLNKLSVPFDANTKTLGLCPGAEYGEAKRWPAEYYAEVANFALNNGWQVVLFGSDKDVPVSSQINQITQNRCIDLGGKTKLGEAIDVMSLCETVISNDSGLMHVAAALIKENEKHKKLIAIFGSSDPYHTPPMSNQTVIEYLGLECSPCFKRECPLKAPDAHLACLRNILPVNIKLKVL